MMAPTTPFRAAARRWAIRLGLLAALLTVAAWLASVRWNYGVDRVRNTDVFAHRGRVVIHWMSDDWGAPLQLKPSGAFWRTFRYGSHEWEFSYSEGSGTWYLCIPLWCPFAASLLWTGAWWGWGWQARRRLAQGACKRCGYDLVGLAAGGVCPECGGTFTPRTGGMGRGGRIPSRVRE